LTQFIKESRNTLETQTIPHAKHTQQKLSKIMPETQIEKQRMEEGDEREREKR